MGLDLHSQLLEYLRAIGWALTASIGFSLIVFYLLTKRKRFFWLYWIIGRIIWIKGIILPFCLTKHGKAELFKTSKSINLKTFGHSGR